MNKIRVLVANGPRVMREVVMATISAKPDVEIVGEIEDEFQDEPAILSAIEQVDPDFLIVTLEESGQPPAICNTVLSKYPKVKILAVAAGPSDSMFYWALLNIQSRPIKTSEEGLLNVLRVTS